MMKNRNIFGKVLLIAILLLVAAYFYFTSTTAVTSTIDSFVYDLPYAKGSSYRLVQGYGGRFSHSHRAALDFQMPEGTPIHASRGGLVFAYKDDSQEGGPLARYNNKANYLIIRHDDGTFGCYWHLKKSGVVTKKGYVRKGQLIGYSGSTGFVLRPHLHFAVKRKLNYDKESFVRTRFQTTRGVQLLRQGESYQKP